MNSPILPNLCFFVLDFDRTLGNTDALNEVLEQVITQHTSLEIHVLRQARAKVEAEKKSFDTVRFLQQYLHETVGEPTWTELQQIFVQEARRADMLQPYAKELLDVLDKKSLPYGIITFGGEAWQLSKIEGAGLLDIPHIVTHIQEKGGLLEGWKEPSGEFTIPPALTRNFMPLKVELIVFIDDKPVSFYNLPKGVVGVRVRPVEGLVLPIQQTPVPAGVHEVDGLNGAIKLLFGTEESINIDKP